MSGSQVVRESEPHPMRKLVSLRDPNGLIDLRRLKLLSVILPVAFIVAIEVTCFAIPESGRLAWAGYVALVVVPVVSGAAFASMVFQFIGRAQRHVLRQNRDLAAANAVATAVRGELGVAQIVEKALQSILEQSAAVDASIELSGSFAGAPDDATASRCWRATSTAHGPDVQPGPVIEVPLASSTSAIGVIRLRLPVGARDRDTLGTHTLRSIGGQLGSTIQIAHLVDDLQRRKHEGHGFYDVLLRISNQNPLADVLGAVVHQAQDLLSCDEAMLCLNDDAFRLVHVAGMGERQISIGATTSCFTPDGGPCQHIHGRARACPTRCSPEWAASLAVPVGHATCTMGELWIGRRAAVPFGRRDRSFLDALSGLAAIAITSARMRDNERQAAILAERERIAREMHDSLAQVLGVTHLQLRALDSRLAVRAAPSLAAELAQLADICEEAYRDVREAILGLRESSRADRTLLENLRIYIDKYSHHSGIDASLVSELDHDLVLPPRTEVQIIRVIQEALTNVRKHSGAGSVVVRISDSPVATTFSVEDDGHGFDACATPLDGDRFGMYTMRERIRLLRGRLTVDSIPGSGTRVIAEVPVVSQSQPEVAEVQGARS